jgi:hypothetical protein
VADPRRYADCCLANFWHDAEIFGPVLDHGGAAQQGFGERRIND